MLKAFLKRQRIRFSLWVLDKIVGSEPDNPQAYEVRGQYRHASGDVEGALADYSRLIALQPRSSKAYYQRGRIYRRQGRLEEALADLDWALSIDSHFAGAHTVRGSVLVDLRRHEEAMEAYRRAVELDPDDEVNYIGQCIVLLLWKQYDKALEVADVAVKLAPKLAESHQYRGEALAGLGRYEEALAEYDKAIKVGSIPHRSLWARAGVQNGLGRHREALKDCDRALRLDETIAGFWVTRGWTLAYLNQMAEAEASFRRALQIDPDDLENGNNAKGGLAWIYAASLDAAVHTPEHAQEALSLALEIQDGPTTFAAISRLNILAAAYAENGQFDKAVEVQQAVVDMEGEPLSHETKARLDAYRSGQPCRESLCGEED
jgi:tetratricopeptide (TPR) repeat protein